MKLEGADMRKDQKFDDGKICAFYQVMQGYVVYRKDGRSNIYY